MAMATDLEAHVSSLSRQYDAVVVGAGPAGAMTARQLARRGREVLLVDKAAFPRDKVCGCCVSRAAWSLLREEGLDGLSNALSAVPLHHLHLRAGCRQVHLALPDSAAVSRSALDDALVRAAVRSGAVFMDRQRAVLGETHESHRCVKLYDREGVVTQVGATVVIAADGLGGRLLDDEASLRVTVAAASRLGVQAMMTSVPHWLNAGTVQMICGDGGYVGIVQVEDGRANVAAALDADFLHRHRSAGCAIQSLLDQSQLDLPGVMEASWRGTAPLTRRRALGAHRLLVVGDAGGYVEPFTGEGIAWALLSANALAALLNEQTMRRWDPHLEWRWQKAHHRLMGSRQRQCRLLSQMLRRPRLMRAIVGGLSSAPWIGQAVVGWVHTPMRMDARWQEGRLGLWV